VLHLTSICVEYHLFVLETSALASLRVCYKPYLVQLALRIIVLKLLPIALEPLQKESRTPIENNGTKATSCMRVTQSD
jgi:hypothetical protein